MLKAIPNLSSRTAASPSQPRFGSRDMRDWFLTLDNDELVDLALTENGMSASVTAKGRLTLGLYRPFPTTTQRLRPTAIPILQEQDR